MCSSREPRLLAHQAQIAHFFAERELGRGNDGNDFPNMRLRLVCGSPVAGGIIGNNNQYLGAHFFAQASSPSPK
jgi:hypothetical protein